MTKITLLLLQLLATSLFLTSTLAITTKPHQQLVIPIHQDRATALLVASFTAKTPRKLFDLVVDITARSLWANCETGYTSKTLKSAKCGTPQCKTANTSFCHTCGPVARPFCHANTCGLLLENPVSHQSTIGEVWQDVLALHSTDGSTPGPVKKIPGFLFTCAPSALIEIGLPMGAQGIAGLAQAPIAIQNQLAFRLKIQPKFTMCLPSGTGKGPLFFGDGPFNLLPNIKGETLMSYTPITISSFGEYYVTVKSIKINSKHVPIKPSLLTIDSSEVGGTTLSTIEPFTVLKTSIHDTITSFYRKQLSGIPTVEAVPPFKLCFDSTKFSSTILGPGSPSIDLELDGGVTWNFFGANALVLVRPGTICLAVVDGQNKYRASMVIGTYQMQDNFVQVDAGRNRFGFSGLLYGVRTNCGNFNFTSTD